MGSLNVIVTSNLDDDTLASKYERSTSSKYADVQAIAQLLEKLNSGGLSGESGAAPKAVVSVIGNQVYASGTFVLASVIATDAISINGVTFTCMASGATGNQFNVGLSDALTAANMAAAINASSTALVNTQVSAAVTDDSPVTVTITAKIGGYAGNAVTMASADGTIVAGVARLAGGVPDTGTKTYSF